MSVQSQIDRINENVANTYSVLEGYGAEMPQTRNTANLPETAADIKVVLFKEQTLTDEQKAQARKNIGAVAGSFAVNITENGGSYSSDKTSVEILSAYAEGRYVYGLANGVVLNLAGCNSDAALFILNVGTEIGIITVLEDKTATLTNIEVVTSDSLSDAINTALEQAKESGEFDGDVGQRGTGILKITTAPSSYTTATGGFTPTYRVALSTVLSQAKVTEVLVGDTVGYSYYHYPVGYVDSSYVYLGTRVSIRGATGAAGDDGKTPVKGTDYWTSSDKTEMVNAVLTALPTWTGGSY